MSKTAEIRSLTSLKGLMILCIVLFHVNSTFGSPSIPYIPLKSIYHFGGFIGNYFFFMISGYLSCRAYRDRISDGSLTVTGYIGSKLTKWYPLFLITNIISLIQYIREEGFTYMVSLKKLISVFTMTSAGWIHDEFPYNYPCWFICVILLCQILFWILMRIYKRSRNAYVLTLFALIFWGFILMQYDIHKPFMYTNDGEGISNFFTGVLIYDLFDLFKMYSEKHPDKPYNMIASVTGLTILVGICLSGLHFGLDNICGDTRIVITVLIMPITIFIVPSLSVLDKILSVPPLYYLGCISMSIFFWHIPLQKFYTDILFMIPGFEQISGGIQLLLYLILLIILGGLSYRFIEKSFRKKRN